MLLPITPLPRRVFTLAPDCRTLVTEASCLGWRPGSTGFTRLYDDACDEGVALEAHDGTLKRFYLSETEMRDGDIVAWHLRPVEPMVFRMTIFND